MKKMFVTMLFAMATMSWAVAQQPGMAGQSGSAAGQSAGSMGGQSAGSAAVQTAGQPGMQGPGANVAVTQGCLGGSNPNFTITDQSGTTYKLNIPPTADTSKLGQHVGESVQVAGNVKNAGNPSNATIDVQGIGRGTGKCPASGSTGGQTTPKQ